MVIINDVFQILQFSSLSRGFPSGSEVKNPLAMQELPETWVQTLGWEDTLEEGTATQSSILARKIPQTEKPGVDTTEVSERECFS